MRLPWAQRQAATERSEAKQRSKATLPFALKSESKFRNRFYPKFPRSIFDYLLPENSEPKFENQFTR